MKVALFGPYPPPAGGISVHIKRLSSKLEECGVKNSVYDIHGRFEIKNNNYKEITFKKIWLFKYLLNIKEDIIHVHMNDWKYRAALTLISRMRGKKIIFTFHSLRDEWNKMSFTQKVIVSYVLKNADYLIATGENEKEKLISWHECSNKISTISAFIPPQLEDIEMPKYVDEFLGNHKIIISANGSNMDFYNNLDLYGLDMCVELCGKLSKSYDVGFIYCLTRITNPEYLEEIREKIKLLDMESKFLIVIEHMEFSNVLKRSDVFIRPTNTDSYGVSIAEAISFGVPSIASNVCIRPKGTIMFESRNSVDLYSKVKEVLNDYNYYKSILLDIEIEGCAEKVLSVYEDLLENR